jgi:hypothetical protein
MHKALRAFGAAAPTSNTLLKLEPQHRMTQPSGAQAAQEKLLADHGRRTNTRGRRPGLKVKLPPLRQCQPSRQPRRTSDTRQSPKPCKQVLRLLKHLPTMYREAATSTHNPKLSEAAAPTSSNLDARGVPCNICKLTLQGDALKR